MMPEAPWHKPQTPDGLNISKTTYMKKNLETLCVQAGWTPKNGEPRVLPIYQSTTFKYSTSEEMARLFDLEDEGYFYTRLSNPTNDAVLQRSMHSKAVLEPYLLLQDRLPISMQFSTSARPATTSLHAIQSTEAHSISSALL